MTTKTPLIILLVTIRTMNEIRISPHIEHNADAEVKKLCRLSDDVLWKLSEKKKKQRTRNFLLTPQQKTHRT
jgi:hypothetical protein